MNGRLVGNAGSYSERQNKLHELIYAELIHDASLMRVAEIRPILHPGAPPHTVALVLVTRMQLAAPQGSNIEGLYFLRHQAEIGDRLFPATETEAPDVEPPDGDESGPATPSTLIIP